MMFPSSKSTHHPTNKKSHGLNFFIRKSYERYNILLLHTNIDWHWRGFSYDTSFEGVKYLKKMFCVICLLNLKKIYIEYTFKGVLLPFNFISPLRDALSYKSFFRLIYIS